MRVAVAGGTGVAGRHVVQALQEDGHEAVVLSRSRGVDVTTGAGLDDALAGVRAVVDVTGTSATGRRAMAFFTGGTARLLAAEGRAGVGHHVLLSIVGCDLVPWGYYRAKAAQEELVLSGATPATVLRATQFHEFAGQLLARTPGPVAVVPRLRTQPVAARDVAAALAGLAVGPAAGRAPELGGPEEHDLVDLARRLLRAQRSRRRVVPLRVPGRAGRELAAGALLPAAGARGTQTFADWLAGGRAPGVSPG